MNIIVLFTMLALASGVASFPAQKVDDDKYYSYNMGAPTSKSDVPLSPVSASIATDRSDDPGHRNARNFAAMIGPGLGVGFPFVRGFPHFGHGPVTMGTGYGPSSASRAPGFLNNPLRF